MPQSVSEIVWYTGLNVHRESSGAFSICHKKGGHKQHLFQQHVFLFYIYKSGPNNNSKEQALLMNQDREKRPEFKIFDNIEDLSIKSF